MKCIAYSLSSWQRKRSTTNWRKSSVLLKAESRPLDACAEGRQRRLVMISIECRRLFLKTANPELPSLIGHAGSAGR